MALCWGSPRNKKNPSKTMFNNDQTLGKAGLGKLRYKKTGYGFETGFVSSQSGVLKMILKLFRVVWVVRAIVWK